MVSRIFITDEILQFPFKTFILYITCPSGSQRQMFIIPAGNKLDIVIQFIKGIFDGCNTFVLFSIKCPGKFATGRVVENVMELPPVGTGSFFIIKVEIIKNIKNIIGIPGGGKTPIDPLWFCIRIPKGYISILTQRKEMITVSNGSD